MALTKQIFKTVLQLQSRSMKLFRPDNIAVQFTIKAAPSNYFRNTSGPEDMAMEGSEFVIDADYISAVTLDPKFKRGDVLRDTELGDMSIKEIRPMYDLGGVIIGYRVRTEV